MTHAACAMVRTLRAGDRLGLLYGQGGFVTKHHALVLSSDAPEKILSQDTNVQDEVNRRRGPIPRFVTQTSGEARIESFTVLYDRNGEIEHGVVMLQTTEGARALARTPADDRATLAHLLDLDHSPVGSRGTVTTAGDGLLEWRVRR